MKYVMVFFLLAAFPAFAAPPPPVAQQGSGYIQKSQRYVECTVKSREDPTKALLDANEWFRTTQDPAAQHCAALSLYNLRRYDEAAGALEALGNSIGNDQVALKASVLTQAAYSWKLASRFDRAEKAYNDAITLSATSGKNELTSNLLYDRAQLYIAQQKPLQAAQDLDHMLSLNDKNVKARMLRAKLYTDLKQDGLAREDYTQVLAVQPGNTEAKEALQRLGAGDASVPPPITHKVVKASPPPAKKKTVKAPVKKKPVKKKTKAAAK